MKKIIGVLIVFSLLFISEKALAVLSFGCGSRPACDISHTGAGVCKKNMISYLNCKEKEDANKQKELEKEKLELEAKQQIFNDRKDSLSIYENFFENVGVNLNIDTTEEQYNQWLKELKGAEVNSIKEQENKQRIKELEERINTLEPKPTIVEKVITPTEVINTHNKEDVIKPTINDNKIVKPVIKKEETKKEIVEEKTSPIIETTTTTETPIIPTNKSFFQRVFGWFKSLL